MFRVIRKIHLYTSFVIASFLLMYFLTGAVMVFDDVFNRMDTKNFSEKVAIKNNRTETQTVAEICRHYNISGEESVNRNNNENSYSYFRPGYKAELFFSKKDTSVYVKIQKGNFGRVMNDFHRLRGYKGSWTHIVWAFLYDLSCIALLIFAFSGIYLWWKLERKKQIGIIFLFASTGITVFTIWYIFLIS